MERTERLAALDGLRAIAILLVIGYHYFYALAAPGNLTTIYPYGDAFAGFPIFKFGYLGVELFFTISGFVIALTLKACATPQEFIARRFARIWPPLLAWSILTFFIVRLSNSPFSLNSNQEWPNFLPSLTMTPPELWKWVSPKVRAIDFAYWSLVVEFRFYFIAALLFWAFGGDHIGRNLVILACVNILIKTGIKFASVDASDLYFKLFIPSFLPWFAAGAVFYDLYERRLRPRTAIVLLVPMFAIIARYSFLDREPSPLVVCAATLSIFVTFWLIATRSVTARFLAGGTLAWIGACSYSIYLIHFEIGAVLISFIPKSIPMVAQIAAVLAFTITIILVGYLSYLTFERYGKTWMIALLRRRSV
jgi:peptidoglycan/LPS O-acetylase OafA/YrhL